MAETDIARAKRFLAQDKHFNPMLEAYERSSAKVLRSIEASQLIRSALQGGFCRMLTRNGDIQGIVIAEKSSFDTQHFGFGVGRMRLLSISEHLTSGCSPQVRDLLVESSGDWMKQNGVECVIVRVDMNDQESILALERKGFATFDILTTFNANTAFVAENSKHLSGDVEVEAVQLEDEQILMDIARKAFRNDHFHRDPGFAKQLSDELYAEWVRNCCHGLVDAVLVAREWQEPPLGFVTCRVKQIGRSRYGVIDLIAVSPSHQDKGIGRFLVREACKWFSRNRVRFAFVGTQVNNLPAVKMYENSGFRSVSKEATLHKWFGD